MPGMAMMQEIPCRDTDPLPREEDSSSRDSPVAFTIDFGGSDNSEEKAKKLERFALRSSLRKPQSPRSAAEQPEPPAAYNGSNSAASAMPTRNPTTAAISEQRRSAESGKQRSLKRESSFVRQKSNLTSRSAVASAAAPLRQPTTPVHRLLETAAAKKSPVILTQQSPLGSPRKALPAAKALAGGSVVSRMQHHSSVATERTGSGGGGIAVSPLVLSSGTFNRRLTATLSPEECKMMFTHTEKIENLEIVENYDEDSFEIEDEDDEDLLVDDDDMDQPLGAKESTPSETGTYTIENEKEEKKLKTARSDLETLIGASKSDRANYVHDWASKHATGLAVVPPIGALHSAAAAASSLSPTSPTGQQSSLGLLDSAAAASPGLRSSLLTRSRRRLPAVPGGGAGGQSPAAQSPDQQLTFSPDSDSPSPVHQESDEGESSYMKHTQHLVDIMEARISKISQKTSKNVANRTLVSKSISSVTKTTASKTTSLEGATSKEAKEKEAWERRKNYDPLAASGKKKEVGRKLSSSSQTTTSPRTNNIGTIEEGRYNSSPRGSEGSDLRPTAVTPVSGDTSARSAPGSARSSDSSGYFSRSDGGRFSMRSNSGSSSSRSGASKSAGPLRALATHQQQSRGASSKLLTSLSAAEIKLQSSRSSSSLTSKEAEFQAWKRRKNYDPLKSAAAAAATGSQQRKTSSPKNAYSPAPPNSGPASPSPTHQHPQHQPPQHRRIQDMTQSLHQQDSSDDGAPIQRSASFHYENTRACRGLLYPIHQLTSEDDESEDYGSGCDSSQAEARPYYLDEDELILPIYPSASQRSLYATGPANGKGHIGSKISPSRSRSRLEALDNLVISTIYSVSSKLCKSSSGLIRRAGTTFPPQDEDQATTIETVLYLLEDVDLPSSPAKKTSRELSGTLRNLKKVEQALEMLNKMLDTDSESN